ncbi:hypothetical protein GCM10009556_104730 [Acrocarpospora pleiomorpha]|uniref:DUF6879 family protein n=1 Tax=Acrocarpospora pleiomorpha TaxID=90975 RepID=UPI0031DB5ABE
MSLVDGFKNFTVSAFRLETLPAYDVPDEVEELEAFRAGRSLPERSVRTSPWLADMAASTAAGREWRRLRLISAQPTMYEAWEVGRYVESQACGEQVRLIDRAQHPELGDRDFWLFDAGTPTAAAYLMQYDEQGGFHGADQAAAELLPGLVAIAELWNNAVSLNTYLTTFDSGRAQLSA